MSSQIDNMHLPASIIAIGAGNRMKTYMQYLRLHPNDAKLVAVVEPNELRRNNLSDEFNIPQERRYTSYEEFFENPVPADAVFVCTPDNEHYRPCLLAVQHGYHVLLEKPIAQSYQECLELNEAAKENNVKVCICHVMRYYPCYIKLKELVQSGELGKVLSIEHIEKVGIDRFLHGYVRGIWNKARTSNPMFLAKCCHDVDFLQWLFSGETKCVKVSSFGSLKWLKAENAPKQSSLRCIDCPQESSCPYSAVNLYLRRREWIRNIDIYDDETQEDAILRELKDGSIGRCVFHCDNDVVDHQTVILEMSDGSTVTIMMDCLTLKDVRKIHIVLTEGEIDCDETSIKISRFLDRSEQIIDFSESLSQPYHAGADLKIVEEFLQYISGRQDFLTSLLEFSMPSHQICFAAEESRNTGKTIYLS